MLKTNYNCTNPSVLSPYVFIDDITNNQENIQIPFINMINTQSILKSVSYVPNNILTSSALAEDFESIPLPCKCKDICVNCICGLGSNIAYEKGILSEDFIGDAAKPITECSVLCTCKNCPNRVVQRGIMIHLQVFMTEHKGFGVQTLECIPKLAFVCEYAGELIDKSEAQLRMKNRPAQEPNYIFVLNEFSSELLNTCTIIDPTFNGNVGRYLNHSCSPNLIPVPVRANSMVPRICFFAKRDIMPYEELTYDYARNVYQGKSVGLNDHGNDNIEANKKCYCNTEHCLGDLPFVSNWLC